ncbi:hypothetical protein FRC19_008852 [Serendipita sp. 401]|nr:hypothetical protein FRC19_008852 [Serendipita sp. 401]KAG9051512.1 hypothetical protein FS842_011214 [Serendipita sp. 407]
MHNMKRKRPDGQDDEREPDHGPIGSITEVPAVQVGLVGVAKGGRVAEVVHQSVASWDAPSTTPKLLQASHSTHNALPFTWEADCREGSKVNSRRSLRGLYEEVHWAERLYGLHRARDDDVGVIDQAQARIVAARDKLSSKVEEMVSEGSYFILKDVLGSQKPISFGFD